MREIERAGLKVVESVSKSMMADQGGDLRDEGASGAGFWLIDETKDGREWVLIARFTCFETAIAFANEKRVEFIREE